MLCNKKLKDRNILSYVIKKNERWKTYEVIIQANYNVIKKIERWKTYVSHSVDNYWEICFERVVISFISIINW